MQNSGKTKDLNEDNVGMNRKQNGFGDVFTGVTVNDDTNADVIRQRELIIEKDTDMQSSDDEEHPFVKVESNKRLTTNGQALKQKNGKHLPDKSPMTQEVITYSDVAFAAWGDIGRFIVDGSLICARPQ